MVIRAEYVINFDIFIILNLKFKGGYKIGAIILGFLQIVCIITAVLLNRFRKG